MIKVTNLTVRRGGREILHSVSATFSTGEVVALLGPNGAGKSTLLRALAGLEPDVAGKIEIDGGADQSDARARARHLAYLPQDHIVNWPLAVRDVVALGRMPYHSTLSRRTERDEQLIVQAMETVGVAHLAGRVATTLSGGELARVLVARLLAQDTPIILADEPMAGLDPNHALGLFETLRGLAQHGRLVVIALHDLSLALRFCDRALLLKSGHHVAGGATRDVLTRTHIASAYGVAASIGAVDGVPVVVPSTHMSS